MGRFSLSLPGEKKQEHRDDKNHRLEISYGLFEQSFALPNNAEAHRAKAKYKRGELTVQIPQNPKI